MSYEEDTKKECISLAIATYNRMLNDPDYGLMEYNNWCMEEGLDRESMGVKVRWYTEFVCDPVKDGYKYEEAVRNALYKHANSKLTRKDVW